MKFCHDLVNILAENQTFDFLDTVDLEANDLRRLVAGQLLIDTELAVEMQYHNDIFERFKKKEADCCRQTKVIIEEKLDK